MITDAFEILANPASLARQLLSSFLATFVASQVYLLTLHSELKGSQLLDSLDELAVNVGVSNVVFLLGACLTVSLTLLFLSRPIYRFLEGYSGRQLLTWFEHRHRFKQGLLANAASLAGKKSWDEIDWNPLSSASIGSFDSICLTLARRRNWRETKELPPKWWPIGTSPDVDDYPSKPEWVLPTRFGNITRSAETYGYHEYGLDLITFWNELSALVPAEVRQSYDRAKLGTDLIVTTSVLNYSLMISYIGASYVGRLSQERASVYLIVSIVAALVLARALARSARSWRSPLRAIVHLGRKPFAAALGFSLPRSLEEEHRMWSRLTGTVQYRSEEWRSRHSLDRIDLWITDNGSGDRVAIPKVSNPSGQE